MVVSSLAAMLVLIGSNDPLWGMRGLKPGNPLCDSLYLGTGEGPFGFWWGSSYPYADRSGDTTFWFHSSTDSILKWNDSLKTLGYSFVFFTLADGTPSCWSAMPFGWDELHPGNPNRYDTLARWAMQEIMDVHFWPPADPSKWSKDVDSVISYAHMLYSTGRRGPIEYFRFLNEPDAYRRHTLMAYYNVFVKAPPDTLDTFEYTYSVSDRFRIIVEKNEDLRDSTKRALITFYFHKWNPDEGWQPDSTFHETLRVSPEFEVWVKDTAWTPGYCVRFIEKPTDSILKAHFPDAKIACIPKSFDLCGYERPPAHGDSSWPGDSKWPWPYIINDPDSPGLYQWYDDYLSACEENDYWPDVMDYHLYTSWQIRSSEDPNRPYFTNPWETLPQALQAIVDVQKAHNKANIPIFISEIGTNSNTPASGTQWNIPWQARCDTQAVHLVAFHDVIRKYISPDSFNVVALAWYRFLESRWAYINWKDDWGIVAWWPLGDTLGEIFPKQAYYAFRNYQQSYALNDSLLACRDPLATWGPGDNIAPCASVGPSGITYWVAFPFRQYQVEAEGLVMKGIRIVRVDSTGKVDSVINLTEAPYDSVEQVAVAGVPSGPCFAFTTHGGSLIYGYVNGDTVQTYQFWSSSDHTTARFPKLRAVGDTVHLVFTGWYNGHYYAVWKRFIYDNPPGTEHLTYIGNSPEWMSFALNDQNNPWVVWQRNDSVKLTFWNGSSWANPIVIASSNARWPDIALNGSNEAWIAWHDTQKDSIRVKGQVISPPFSPSPKFNGSVGPAREDSSFPRIRMHGSNAYVLWADSQQVIVNGQQNPYKKWSYDIRLAYGTQSSNGGFGTTYSFSDTLVGESPLHSLFPSFALRDSARLSVVWTEGEFDIHRIDHQLMDIGPGVQLLEPTGGEIYQVNLDSIRVRWSFRPGSFGKSQSRAYVYLKTTPDSTLQSGTVVGQDSEYVFQPVDHIDDSMWVEVRAIDALNMDATALSDPIESWYMVGNTGKNEPKITAKQGPLGSEDWCSFTRQNQDISQLHTIDDTSTTQMQLAQNSISSSVFTLKNASGQDSAVLFLYPSPTHLRWSYQGTSPCSTAVSPAMTGEFSPYIRDSVLFFVYYHSGGETQDTEYYNACNLRTGQLQTSNSTQVGQIKRLPSLCVDENDTVHLCYITLQGHMLHQQWHISNPSNRDTDTIASGVENGRMHLDGDSLIQVVYQDTSGNILIREWAPGSDPSTGFTWTVARGNQTWAYEYPDIRGDVIAAIKRHVNMASENDTLFLVRFTETKGETYGWNEELMDTSTSYLYQWPHISGNDMILWTAYKVDSCTGKVLWKQPQSRSAGFFSKKRFVFYPPLPNPCRDKLIIRFSLPGSEQYALRLYDVSGRRVATIAQGKDEPGMHVLTWTGNNTAEGTIASGVYFIRLTYGKNRQLVKKVVWMK